MARKRLGEILIEAGLIDDTGLRAALVEQRRYGGPLGRVLIDMKLVIEEDLVAALSKQLAIPTIDLDSIEIPQPVLELVPGELAEANGLVPFAQPMKFLDLAMSDPTNQGILDELRVKTKLNLRPYLAGPKAIERAVARWYGRGVVNARGAMPGRRKRESVAVDDSPPPKGRMEVTSGFEIDQELARTATPMRAPGFSHPAHPVPEPVGPRPVTQPPAFAALATLQERVSSLEALVHRDEDVIKKLMAMLIEKGVVSRDELIARLK
jgi:type IV pilus assembly protein PilB